jgi:hypothetical protein
VCVLSIFPFFNIKVKVRFRARTKVKVRGPIDMRVWKGRRFENILKLDRDLR